MGRKSTHPRYLLVIAEERTGPKTRWACRRILCPLRLGAMQQHGVSCVNFPLSTYSVVGEKNVSEEIRIVGESKPCSVYMLELPWFFRSLKRFFTLPSGAARGSLSFCEKERVLQVAGNGCNPGRPPMLAAPHQRNSAHRCPLVTTRVTRIRSSRGRLSRNSACAAIFSQSVVWLLKMGNQCVTMEAISFA
jgi:hypothetical protein